MQEQLPRCRDTLRAALAAAANGSVTYVSTAHRGVVVEAAPSAAFEMSEPDLLFELLIVAFDAEAQFGSINKRRKLHVFWQGREGHSINSHSSGRVASRFEDINLK
jgi:hypothetical protein